MTVREQTRGDMAALDSAALPVPAAAESSRPRTRLVGARFILARAPADSLWDLWDGASWEPGRDWLTHAVPDIGGFWRPPPADRQEPR